MIKGCWVWMISIKRLGLIVSPETLKSIGYISRSLNLLPVYLKKFSSELILWCFRRLCKKQFAILLHKHLLYQLLYSGFPEFVTLFSKKFFCTKKPVRAYQLTGFEERSISFWWWIVSSLYSDLTGTLHLSGRKQLCYCLITFPAYNSSPLSSFIFIR